MMISEDPFEVFFGQLQQFLTAISKKDSFLKSTKVKFFQVYILNKSAVLSLEYDNLEYLEYRQYDPS